MVTETDQSISTEAQVGARWWANHLRDPDSVEHDAGDVEINAITNWARENDARNNDFDSEKVDEFETRVAQKLQQCIDDRRTWDYQKPYIGSTFIKCDYHAHPILQEATENVGIEISSMTTFPTKTSMWLEPGHVYVSTGYRSPIETIWEIGDYLNDIESIVSDWEWKVEHPDQDAVFEHDAKVFPVDDGYLIRAYGQYDPEAYGPEHREFKLLNDELQLNGVETMLESLKDEINSWREEE